MADGRSSPTRYYYSWHDGSSILVFVETCTPFGNDFPEIAHSWGFFNERKVDLVTFERRRGDIIVLWKSHILVDFLFHDAFVVIMKAHWCLDALYRFMP